MAVPGPIEDSGQLLVTTLGLRSLPSVRGYQARRNRSVVRTSVVMFGGSATFIVSDSRNEENKTYVI